MAPLDEGVVGDGLLLQAKVSAPTHKAVAAWVIFMVDSKSNDEAIIR
jgi:hypothetical protein